MSIRSALALFPVFIPIFVSATDLEVITVSATPVHLSEAGSSVSVITREDISRRNLANLTDILRTVPGFAVSQQGSHGAITQLRVRGAEANQVLVLIDGIEVNDLSQGSEFDFSQVATQDIERIEIVRGAQSALWGSDAMSGVINIITRPGDIATGWSARLESGSFGTNHGATTFRYAGEKLRLQTSLDYLDSEGTNISRSGNEKDGHENTTYSVSGDYRLSKSIRLGFTARHTDKSTEFDDIDFFTTGLPVDADFDTNSEHFYTGLQLSQDLSDQIDHTFYVTRTKSENVTQTSAPVRDVASGRKESARYQINYTSNAHTLSILAGYERESFQQRGSASFFGDPNQNQDAATRSLAGEYRLDLDRLHLSFSARRDNNTEFDDSTSWRATANTELGGFILHAAVGESTKNPTFTERFGYFTNFAGNPGLKPESSFQWEVGARRSWLEGDVATSITYFNADLEDEINGFFFDLAAGGFTSVNIDGESARQGIEATLNYRITDHWDLTAAYTYLDSEQDDATGNPQTEVRRPDHAGSASLSYSDERLNLTLAITHTGEQEDDYFPPYPPFQERVELDAFTIISLSGNYSLNKNVALTARLENISDKDYEQVFGFQSPGFGAYAGVKLSW